MIRELTHEDLVQLWLHRLFAKEADRMRLFRSDDFRDDDVAVGLGLDRWLTMQVVPSAVIQEMNGRHRQLEERLRRKGLAKVLRENFARIRAFGKLTEEEVEVLRFIVVFEKESVLEDGLDLIPIHKTSRFYSRIGKMLRMPGEKVAEALSPKGRLHRLGLLKEGGHRSRRTELLPSFFSPKAARTLLRGVVEIADLLREVARPAPAPELRYRDFPHWQKELGLLRPYLRQALREGKPGMNIFLYGPPGTGKTQMARILAREMRCPLYELAAEDEEGNAVEPKHRLNRIRLAGSMLPRRSLLLVDEAEDVFSSGSLFSASPSGSHKAWLHATLEQSPVPVIWIANDLAGVDPSNARRFTFLFEMPVPPKAQRKRMIRASCGMVVSEAMQERLSASASLSPAVVNRATQVLNSLPAAAMPDGSADEAMALMVNSTLKAQGYRELPRKGRSGPEEPMSLPGHYDLSLLHCERDLASLAERIAQKDRATLCLYGPPGTGKTCFAHYLARKMGKAVHQHRASTLLSPYVGEAEKRIARAFAHAETEGAVLIIDEVDSFLRDRHHARASWEVSHVNELLTQMDGYPGFFFASTNLYRDLDAAALRRFDLKLFFDYLLPEQAVRLLRAHCNELALGQPAAVVEERIASMARLTPGDFDNVRRQAALLPMFAPEAFLRCLGEELEAKGPSPRPVAGFAVAG